MNTRIEWAVVDRAFRSMVLHYHTMAAAPQTSTWMAAGYLAAAEECSRQHDRMLDVLKAQEEGTEHSQGGQGTDAGTEALGVTTEAFLKAVSDAYSATHQPPDDEDDCVSDLIGECVKKRLRDSFDFDAKP
jgi:hypothetical protein